MRAGTKIHMPKHQNQIFIFAGESSADMHGGKLISALQKELPASFFGVGGPEMCSQDFQAIYHTEDFSVMGFSDVLRSLPRLIKQFRHLRRVILEHSPKVVIFIDSPSFSLRMAKSLRQRGYKGKIVQYTCPSVWAYGKERIKALEAHFDLLLTIYPFEVDYFQHSSLPTKYVGNPLKERIQEHHYTEIKQSKSPLLALFPGSRPGEILRNLPQQLEAYKILLKNGHEIDGAISCSHVHLLPLIEKAIHDAGLKKENFILIPKELTYDLMRYSKAAIAKSGTVTLELALHSCPTVVIYGLTWLNRMMAKHILRLNLPFYCIVNILAGKKVFPELIAEKVTAQSLYQSIERLLNDDSARQTCIAECQSINQLLGPQKASQIVSSEIIKIVKK